MTALLKAGEILTSVWYTLFLVWLPRSCSVCKSPCKNYCTVCSEIANDSIVALCGLKSKQGSACIVKHIYDQWYTVKLNAFGKLTTRKPSDYVYLNEIHIYEPVICITYVKNLFE